MPQKDKKLKTNQMMKVQIGNFGIIEIGHKTEMGRVSQVIEMGNKRRKENGLKPKLLDHILNKSEFWEFIIARNTLFYQNFNSLKLRELKNVDRMGFMPYKITKQLSIKSDFTILDNYQDLVGQIQYSELIKKFPHLIKSKRGRNGGTWAELYILLKIASMLDKDLEVAIYDVFIKSQILQYRDNGGDSFKKLNLAIKKYIPSSSGNNQGRFIQIAKLLREKLEITNTKGYNEIEHNLEIQKRRDEIEKNLIFSLQSKLITSYKQLKNVIENLEIQQ